MSALRRCGSRARRPGPLETELAPIRRPRAASLTKVTAVRGRPAEGAEHRPVVHRLRRRDGGVRVAHRRRGDGAALDDQARLGAEEGRLPEHQVGELADLDRADLVGDAVGDGRVDRVLGDVALGAEVVVAPPAAAAGAALAFILWRSARCGRSPRRPGPWPGSPRR
jgi:hypothetical protein